MYERTYKWKDENYIPLGINAGGTKSTPDTPKIGNGLIQLIRMDGSIRPMWVNNKAIVCL